VAWRVAVFVAAPVFLAIARSALRGPHAHRGVSILRMKRPDFFGGDWVHRYNADGISGLKLWRPASGGPPGAIRRPKQS